MNRLIIYVESIGIFTKMFSTFKGISGMEMKEIMKAIEDVPSQIGEFKVIMLGII